MERQRSFSLKPTRLALFSFTLASPLLICLSLYPRGSPQPSIEAHIQYTSVLWTPETENTAEGSSDGLTGRGEAERLHLERKVPDSSDRGGAGGRSFRGSYLLGPGDSDGEAEGSGGGWEDDSLEEFLSKARAGPSNATAAKEDEDGVALLESDGDADKIRSEVSAGSSNAAAAAAKGDDGGDKDVGLLESDDHAAAEAPVSDDSDGEWEEEEEEVPEDGQLGGIVNSTNPMADAQSSSSSAAAGRSAGGTGGEVPDAAPSEGNPRRSEEQRVTSTGRAEESRPVATCDVSSGRWVFDPSYPLYTNQTCPFVDEGFSCQSNGRPDTGYMKWRWQPHHCDFPRFDAVRMLELVRGKRLVFVGDSMNRNQWESLLCMLMQGVRDPKRVIEARGRKITKQKGNYNFRFLDYQCSVEFYVSHFLVREGKARVGRKRVQTLRIDAIDRSSSKWKGADILVFNTAHWWNHHKTKAGNNYFQEGDQVHPHLDVSAAFKKALLTWASWVDRTVSPAKARVFFRTSSPSHFSGGEWNSGGHCRESTAPLNETLPRSVPLMNAVAEQVVDQMKTPVTLLKVTQLSGLRIDGHPSVYGVDPSSGRHRSIQDCSHWCLPGVPDAWNELLYFHLLSSKQKPVVGSI